jgi:hypothetical protein
MFSTRPGAVVQKHLDMAKNIQQKLGNYKGEA